MEIELADAVAVLRDELLVAAGRGAGQDVEFVVGPIEVELTVELRHDRKAKAGFLPARRAVVPFHGREEQLTDLHTGAQAPGVGVWLLHGPGGQGKTRLAHQFGHQLAGQGWAVVWLHPDAAGAQLDVLAEVVRPLLIVVDYAETRPEQLQALLTVVATRQTATPAKVLLLARTAGSWWTRWPRTAPTRCGTWWRPPGWPS